MAKYLTASFKFHLPTSENWKRESSDLVHLTKAPNSDELNVGNRPLVAARPGVNGLLGSGKFLTCGGHVESNDRPVRLV